MNLNIMERIQTVFSNTVVTQISERFQLDGHGGPLNRIDQSGKRMRMRWMLGATVAVPMVLLGRAV
ncbi:hypothetical protein [Burkholderia territorii]|uniref:hypothetical protein n=1 Tax=Burkholderia territorii TaxID=1503055 RepID=UPI000AD325B8|nr:hypothetical protein [Burkholderia territorii]